MSSVVSSIFGGAPAGGVSAAATQTPSTVEQANQTYQQSQDALRQQQAFVAALQGQGGVQNQSNVFGQLQNVASGQGPNPAQAMLDQATGTNVANQAALMAGQRGSGANAGMIARQAAQQGANTQQQAAGQGAVLQANQSLGALNQMGNIAGQQVGQLAQANQVQGNQALQGQQNILNSIGGQNQNAIAQQDMNSRAAQSQAAMQGQLLGNLAGAAGSAMAMAEGGVVQQPAGPRSHIARHMMATGGSVENRTQATTEAGRLDTGYGRIIFKAEGGAVPAMVSPGEQYLPPQAAKAVAQGKANPLQAGQRIPGKPMIPGDSYANDVVPKVLAEGGIVIPNSIMQAKDAEKKAAEFVKAILARQSLPSKASK